MNQAPTLFRWDGEALIPRHPKLADQRFVIGCDYLMEEREDRTPASHRAYFAAVNECWKSLPEHLKSAFPTADALRKAALIATGWCDRLTEACASNAEARRTAGLLQRFMAPDAYPEISIKGNILVVLTARSQSFKAMAKADFRASSEAVLRHLAEMLGVPVGQLPSHEAA